MVMTTTVTSLTLDGLCVLDAIARAGSFAGGAEELCRVPSGVSYTISKLERDLGVRVFDRTGYRAKLTCAGRQLLADGRELLRLAGAAEHRARELNAGRTSRITIAVSEAVPRSAIFSLLRAFHNLADHRTISVDVTNELLPTVWQSLACGRCDVVIGAPEQSPDSGQFVNLPLGDVQLALVVPPTHPLARADEPVPNSMLAAYATVHHLSWPVELLDGIAESHVVTVDSYSALADAIRCGLGIGFLPLHLVQAELDDGRLIAKATTGAPTLRVVAAFRAGPRDPAAQWLVDHLLGLDLWARIPAASPTEPDLAQIP